MIVSIHGIVKCKSSLSYEYAGFKIKERLWYTTKTKLNKISYGFQWRKAPTKCHLSLSLPINRVCFKDFELFLIHTELVFFL